MSVRSNALIALTTGIPRYACAVRYSDARALGDVDDGAFADGSRSRYGDAGK